MLDDVFGDLDPHKTKILLQALDAHEGQVFITAANPFPFEEFVEFDGEMNKFFKVDRAEVLEVRS